MNPIIELILGNMDRDIPAEIHGNADTGRVNINFNAHHRPDIVDTIKAENRNQFMDWWKETGEWWGREMKREFPGQLIARPEKKAADIKRVDPKAEKK